MRRGSMKYILVVTCLSFIFLLTGSWNIITLSFENFNSKMKDNNFIVQDTILQMTNYDYITKFYLAVNSS